MKNRKFNSIFFVLLLFTFGIYLNTDSVLGIENKKNHILIIQSYDESNDWEKKVLDGIKNTLKKELANCSVDVEYMHMKKYSGEQYYKKLIDFYQYKYGNTKYDAIIVCDNYAFDFIREYNDRIFKNTPIVFCGVNGFNKELIKDNKYFTGVVEEADIKGTLNIALEQNQNIEEINVLLSKKSIGSMYKKSFQEVLSSYDGKYKINIVQLSKISEVKLWLNTLNKKSIIILAADLKDDYDEYMNYGEVAKFLAAATDIPIYGLGDYLLGTGVVGGSLIASNYHGEVAAKLAIRIINGEKPENIKIITNTFTQYMFDYNALKKFNISSDNLPQNSKIVNKPNKKCYIDKRLLIFSTILVIIILCLIIIMLTISILKRKKVEIELEESEYQLNAIVNSSPNIICFKDKNGKWLDANKATLKAFKIENVDYKGKTSEELAECIKNKESSLYNCEKTDLIAWETKKVHISELILKEDDDKIYEFIKVPIFYEGRKKALVVLGRDITEEKCNQELLDKVNENQKLLDETLEYDKIKTEFFANISHELKTPLNVIFSTVQLFDLYLRNNQIYGNGVNIDRNIYVLRQNCFRLLRLVNNLIDITKLDSGYFQLNLKNRDIINVIEDITLSVAEFIESKEIQLIFDTDVEEKLMAFDEDKIERIMLNLLSNAVKFTPKGGQILVNIFDMGDKVKIIVKDTGIGIPKDKQEIVFDRFRQVDKSLTRNREGSGIGLSLVKSLVELHNGKIYLRSEEGKGSEFIMELPLVLVEKNENVVENAIRQSCVERINIEFSDIYTN